MVQPLPVTNFSTEFYDKKKTSVFLSWEPQEDSLETTATPSKYVVYTSRNDGGWDNGTLVDAPHCVMPIDSGVIYNFKVTALNDGGERHLDPRPSQQGHPEQTWEQSPNPCSAANTSPSCSTHDIIYSHKG